MHRTAVLLVATLLAACDRDPVDWNDAAERGVPVPPASAAQPLVDVTADSILDATVRAAVADTGTPHGLSVLPADVLEARGPFCPASIRVAAGRGGERDIAWWSLRPDSTTALVVARSADGGESWLPPVVVDSLDRAQVGCARPAPAVAIDSTNGYLHLAYALTAPEGTGVFYAHRMGPTQPFERPQVVTYGDHVTPASIASDGDLVVVGYEDPNTGGKPYVSMALSRTAGHTWDERFAVSNAAVGAVRPRVALRRRTVVVGWVERTPPRVLAATDDPSTASGASVAVVRVGHVR